jgi:predicted DNA-binding protein YlxM (UPF0122 family)
MTHKNKKYSYLLNNSLTYRKLYKTYIIKKMSILQIAKLFKCSSYPISQKLKQFKIISRNSGMATRKYEYILTKKLLIKEYWKNNLSLKEIADKYSISCAKVVLTYFKIYNIKRRTFQLGTKIRLNKIDIKNKFSKMRKGKKHWNFKNWSSRKPYSTKWSDELKLKIRQRDGNKCRICGKKQIKPKLDVHHIDYNKQNCKEENLISLCHRCHTITSNSKRFFWIKFFKNLIKGIKKYANR